MDIIFDGDSILAPGSMGVSVEEGWPALVSVGKQYLNMARNESTAGLCLARLGRVLEEKPRVYVLQVGQWSLGHETLWEFERNVRGIIEGVRRSGMRMILVTPPAT